MSNLISPYEISVWKDQWVDGAFEEYRVCVIGSNQMLSQSRAIEPNFIQNVNGQKKFSFKMYKWYIDNITGLKVENPFVKHLVNEAKVKLYYENKWHDFYIKNITENSSNYLYTYQLEDALVQELSKNGYGVTFDVELMNNLGTADELAATALKDTSWTVEGSEVFVEKVEENLIYIKTSGTFFATRLKDQSNLNLGVVPYANQEVIQSNTIILGFYSSCVNRPHRFQFILLDSYEKEDVRVDERRIIQEPDCQYYIDIAQPLGENGYRPSGDYWLPNGMQIESRSISISDDYDSTVSSWFKGERYGYAQRTVYVPLLNSYCNLYHKFDKILNDYVREEEPDENGDFLPKVYYVYTDSNYSSPIFTQNVITNNEFKSTSGWTGTYTGVSANMKSAVGAKVDCLYGYFSETVFSSADEDLQNGRFNDTKDYLPYLKMYFPPKVGANRGIVINSGFYDNRRLIKIVQNGEAWCFDAKILNNKGQEVNLNDFTIELWEVNYDTTNGYYTLTQKWGSLENGEIIITYPNDITLLSENQFQNKSIKLVIAPKNYNTEDSAETYSDTFYISKMEMYKKVYNNSNTIIKPGTLSTEGTIVNNYVFVEESSLKNAVNTSELEKFSIDERELDYSVYVPIYNEGAQKIRTITAAESNYFNILQSIAETFQCWLDIYITRDSNGKILTKNIKFKNYAGENNHAAFRYGVNLKDIQRTYESNQLVTKLIVRQNNNELGKNGFCTIARAGSNPTGETNIYDFQYFHNLGLLDLNRYLAEMYYETNPYDDNIEAQGPDLSNGTTYNLQNYFNRLKSLNHRLEDINEDYVNYSKEITELNAEKVIQEGLRDAAALGIEESAEKFYSLTGLYPSQIDEEELQKAESLANQTLGEGNRYTSDYNYRELNPSWDFELLTPTFTTTQLGTDNALKWNYGVEFAEIENKSYEMDYFGDDDGYCEFYGENYVSITRYGAYDGIKIDIADEGEKEITYTPGKRYKLSFELFGSGDLVRIGSHMGSFANTEIWINDKLIGTNVDHVSIKGMDREIINVSIYGTFYKNDNDSTPYFVIQPNRGLYGYIECNIYDITLEEYVCKTQTTDKTFYIQPIFVITPKAGATVTRVEKIACKIKAYDVKGNIDYILPIFDSTVSSENALTEYITNKMQYKNSIQRLYGNSIIDENYEFVEPDNIDLDCLVAQLEAKENYVTLLEERQQELITHKTELNKLFYATYSRFIQEGTWMSEDYIEDDKYYNDALSVIYNSCYPQVQYTINVIALNRLPGYENFAFNLGDTTYAEDPDFFGEDLRTEVVVMELSENLDDPSKNTIRVQNFKNQFQDLFQKITATVQQTQYSTGAYKKAVEWAEATGQMKSKFVTDGLSEMSQALSVAGQTTVRQDINGITLTDSNTKNEMRLIGGAILMSIEDQETGQRRWKTGLTPDGINASLITAGNINAGEISIMNTNEPTFKWNSFGISAFNTDWTNGTPNGKVDPYTFVRFDKNGLYGINSSATENNISINGENWHPTSLEEIRDNAIFSLTWDGLTLRPGSAMYYHKDPESGEITNRWHTSSAIIGKVDDYVYNVWDDETGLPKFDITKINTNREFVKIFAVGDGNKNQNLVIYDDGTLTCDNIKLTGSIQWTSASSPSKSVYGKASLATSLPANNTLYKDFPLNDNVDGPAVWHQIVDAVNDFYYAHTDDGGATWQGPFLITGKSISSTEIKYTTAIAGTDPTTLTDESKWSPDRPSLEDTLIGHNIYIRMVDIFNNGTRSSARYIIDGGRTASIRLSREASSIPAAPDGQVEKTLLKNLSKISVVVKDGNEDVTTQEGLQFIWSADGGVIKQTDISESEVNTETTEVCLVTMENNSATVTVNVKSGDMDIDTKTFTISKSIQGADSILCYISSSKGTAFETNESGTTILTAHLLRAGIELDPDNDAFDYVWYYEENEHEDETFGTGKSIECSIADLKNKRVYFVATEKTNEDAESA